MGIKGSGWSERTSGEVVEGAAGGDEGAWAELHRRYSGMIAGVARSVGCATSDVPDVQQAVWSRLIQHIDRLRQPDAVGGWLAVVTKRECVRLARRQRPVSHLDEVPEIAATTSGPLTAVVHAEEKSAVRRAVATLAPRRRRLLEAMLDHPELGYEELASQLSMPIGSIGPTRLRSLADLRQRRELAGWGLTAQPA